MSTDPGKIVNLLDDLGSNVVQEVIRQLNMLRTMHQPLALALIAHAGTGNEPLLMTESATVLEEVMFSSDLLVDQATTSIEIRYYDDWTVATVGAGTLVVSMTDFSAPADQLAIGTPYKLSEVAAAFAGTVAGGLPALIPAGQVVSIEIVNNETVNLLPVVQAVTTPLRQQISLSPNMPKPSIVETTRVR